MQLTVEQATILDDAIKGFGAKHQAFKAIEEMSELIQALCKWDQGGDYMRVLEELADVQIMLMQLIPFFGTVRVNAEIEKKIKRLKEIIPRGEIHEEDKTCAAI